MIDYKEILVLENDSEFQGLPRMLDILEQNENRKFDVWWDFSSSLRDQEAAIKRFKEIPSDTLVVSNPSFVGVGNSMEKYLHFFLMLEELDIKVTIAIVYYDGFFMELLKYVYSEQNYLKKQNNMRILEDVLTFHDIYEIEYDKIHIRDGVISNSSTLLSYENIMNYYYESHRKHRVSVRVKETGEVYPIVHVNHYCDTPQEIELEVMVSEEPYKALHLTIDKIERV